MKLVAEVGVGTVAAGVAKANADHVADRRPRRRHRRLAAVLDRRAGVPWEIGLAETQQTLLLNDLRSRITVQTDGQLKTGRDVVIAALLGADEMGFSTAPLIATGCIMMRACHLNTCPVGIATQDPELRKRFKGTPEHVVNFFFFVAEEVREIMASLGVRTLDELIGRVDLLELDDAIDHWKARGDRPDRAARDPAASCPDDAPRRRVEPPPAVLDDALDWELLERGAPRDRRRGRAASRIERTIRNVNRCVGGILSSEIARAHGAEGLPEDSIERHFRGSAGQSFGGWLAPGRVVHAVRRRQRLHRQGPAAAASLAVLPPDGVTLRRRGERDRRQHRALRRDERQGVLPRPRRRALRRAQLGRQRGRRGRRRPRLRVHDRRPRRRARARPGATSPRA